MQIIWRSTTVIAPHGGPIPTLRTAGPEPPVQQADCSDSCTGRVSFITRVRISIAAWTAR